jgi:hypothetical protein
MWTYSPQLALAFPGDSASPATAKRAAATARIGSGERSRMRISTALILQANGGS